MALDRFVYFTAGKMPEKEAIANSLKNYVGYGIAVTFHGDRWFVGLPGTPEEVHEESQPQRWIEVYIGADNIDVITRHADNFTNAIARGFAERVAREFDGKTEEEAFK